MLWTLPKTPVWYWKQSAGALNINTRRCQEKYNVKKKVYSQLLISVSVSAPKLMLAVLAWQFLLM